MVSVALTTVWWTIGFNFVLYLAGLQEIPRELYEAASIDGAGPWAQLRRITLPLLSRTTVLVLMLQIIASLKIFDQIYLMTGGGPNFATRPVIEYIYDIGFTDFRTGYSAAASILYFIVILAVSLVWFAFNRRQRKEA
jgi:multiple sugar transport system permease protein